MSDSSAPVAIITGASSGIGEATAHALAAEGYRVVLAARREDRLETLKTEIEGNGGTALVVETDVTERAACQALADKTLDAFGRIDVLVNNAGLMPLSLIKNTRLDEWEQMVDVNVKGVLFCTAAVIPAMTEAKAGHIVNVSSVAGRRVFMGGSVYCATKFAVTAFSEGLRQELSPEYGIRVTCIEPGAVATELKQKIQDEDFVAKAQASGMSEGVTPLDAEAISSAIAYAVTAPDGVSVHEMMILPTSQKI